MKNWLKNSGLLLALMSAVSSTLAHAISWVWNWIFSQFMTTTEIERDSVLYDIFCDWLEVHPVSEKARSFDAGLDDVTPSEYDPHGLYGENGGDEDVVSSLRSSRTRTDVEVRPRHRVVLRPNMKIRYFWHEGHWVCVRFKSEQMGQSDSNTNRAPRLHETLEIATFGRNRDMVKKMLEEALALYEKSHRQQTSIFVSYQNNWRRLLRRKLRPLNSVFLPGDDLQRIYDDAYSFINNRKWYEDHGIPHRRGYLFWGPPGTGKTSALQAICGELGISMYILRLSQEGMDDDVLENMMMAVPTDCAVLIEDVDAVFAKRKVQREYSGLTFSGLLNVLDGVASAEGRLLFMTTNHPEKLDAALIRPGRVDFHLKFDYADHQQIKAIYEHFYPLQPESYAREFADALVAASEKITMAQVQQYLLLFKRDGEMAWAHRHEFMQRISKLDEF